MATETTKTGSDNPFSQAIGQAKSAAEDFTRMFSEMKLPAVPDVEALLSAHKRNMETLLGGQPHRPRGRPGGGQAAHGNHAADHVRAERDPAFVRGTDRCAAGEGGQADRTAEEGL